jgi:hypothetical protein
MEVARFLAEVRMRNGTPIPAEVDPIGIILARVGTNPHTIESRALRKVMCAVIATEDHMAEADL